MNTSFGNTIADSTSPCFGCPFATSLVNGLHCTLNDRPVLYATTACSHHDDDPSLAEDARTRFLVRPVQPVDHSLKRARFATRDMEEIANKRKEIRKENAKRARAQKKEDALRAQGQLSLF